MFIPVADEKDIYDTRGRQINDVNTLFDFVNHVVLGNTEVTQQDEDDDQPHYFTGSNSVSYYISSQQEIACSRQEPSTIDLAVAYPLLAVQKPLAIAYEILTPPPEV
ncbi:hypothetical protein SIO70_21520 [Chitinophaga sancti]|uniref:hypothetical protein n=1 Tax=Chitinophaga sancti TaxID=1004 RepID=UPI002A75D724|nr:hypothetical protein [Chitinophaga sancti]WPQ60939.1 hypothetical protein SIO70_21520 [Chitinophaga sancti]